ncbi:putative STOREKEEPER protein-like [Cocos nucifera]|uniref:Putative STOREKEEPER protein-like n=1 Tax=Cocos nucifera TaxID=13894 RepID=A0A8K0IHA4_COCNU|nr:putative STOREKEEPER protein-like [Cocos nucifera]
MVSANIGENSSSPAGCVMDAQDIDAREEEMKARYPHLWEAVTRRVHETEYGGRGMMKNLRKLDDSKAYLAQEILENLDKERLRMTINRTSLMNETFKLLYEGLKKKG